MTARTYWPLLAFLAVVVAGGVAHGVYTDRWVRSPDRDAAARRLESVPTTIGPWVGEDAPIDPEEVRRAGVDGYVLRVYRNPVTGQAVTLFLVSGRPGPVSVHTPDVCYQGSGYRMASAPARESVAGADAVFAAAMQKPAAAVPDALTVRWAWRTPAGGWQAPDRPRVAFARSGVLYKLYVVSDRAAAAVRSGRPDPAVTFLPVALPVLDRALAADPPS